MSRAVITPAVLRAVGATTANAALFAPLMDAGLLVPGDAFNSITSINGVAMFVAQTAHECGSYSALSENLNYSVEALLKKKQFTPEQARAYGRNDATGQKANQKMIGSIMYANRYENRPGTDDGWTFRGGGIIQTTWRYNYRILGKVMGISAEEAAAMVRSPQGAVDAAFQYWRWKPLVLPASRGDVATCTDIINGGENGLSDRVYKFQQARAALRLAA